MSQVEDALRDENRSNTTLQSTGQDDGQDSHPPPLRPNPQRYVSDEQNIRELVRRHSLNLVRKTSRADDAINPFLESHPHLNPSSAEFDARAWAKALLHHSAVDPDTYPRHTAGVAFKQLGVYGFGSDTDYQRTVLNALLTGPALLKQWVCQHRQKIDILRDIDGLVESGQMLLVLGRPGR